VFKSCYIKSQLLLAEKVDMTKKEKIIILFFEDKLTTIEIANKLSITKQYVSKVVRQDSRYNEERENRKITNKNKQKQRVINYINKQRKQKKMDRLDGTVELLHFQASCEMSKRKFINNRAFRNWNSSIYKYHERTKEYRVKKEFEDKVSYAVPKKIKWD
jgi:predicted DNA-binding protein YlxM (UPF0122 family)